MDIPVVYQVATNWYTLISFLIVFLVSMPVSLLTGSIDTSQLDPRLISHPADVLLFWLPEDKRQLFKFDVGENFVSGVCGVAVRVFLRFIP